MTTRTFNGNAVSAGIDDNVVRKAEIIISNVLRGGVLLSVAVLLFGIGDFFLGRLMGAAAPTTFPHTFGGLVSGLEQFHPLAIVVLGLVILLATPVTQLAVSAVAFAIEEDRTYVIVTGLVLAILLFSIFGMGYWLGKPGPAPVQDDTLPFFFLMLGSSVFAGFIGALVGLGGGVFLVPILTLIFHVPFDVAIGASIVSVIALSSAAAAAYVKDRLTNRRVGVLLEVGTTIGAICGALLTTTFLNATMLYIIFGFVLLVSVLPLILRLSEEIPENVKNHKWAERLRLPSSYSDPRTHETHPYHVAHVRIGFTIMYIAGLLSGLLGIGAGVFKVLALDTAMRLPMKVSTTTSNFMIGVTAAASAGIYFQRGAIDPVIAAPIALGILLGATIGIKAFHHFSNAGLRKIFIPIVVLVALNMLARGFGWI
jgi:uncharacterized membrane protein YfcA/uncharacterized membrane protein